MLLFTLILLSVGALMSLGVERALERWPSVSRRQWASVLPLVPMLLFFPILIFAGVVGLVAWGIERSQLATRVWRSKPMSVAGVLLLIVTALWIGLPASSEVGKILT